MQLGGQESSLPQVLPQVYQINDIPRFGGWNESTGVYGHAVGKLCVA